MRNAEPKAPVVRTLLAGVAAGFALNVAMFLTFGLIGFGVGGHGILLNPSLQSPKLIAVWTTLPPLPRIVSQPILMVTALTVLAVLHAFIYRWLAPGWPPGILRRTVRMALLLFLTCFLFFEFFTPFNQLHEPLPLILLELVFWAIVALAEASAIAWIVE